MDYNVFMTRQLNTKIPPDKAYFDGPEAAKDETLYGVFIQVCNRSKETHQTASDFKVKDNQGNEFEPEALAEDNAFAYQPRELAPDECIPEAGSVAELGPTSGSMLLFRLPLQNTENRPSSSRSRARMAGTSRTSSTSRRNKAATPGPARSLCLTRQGRVQHHAGGRCGRRPAGTGPDQHHGDHDLGPLRRCERREPGVGVRGVRREGLAGLGIASVLQLAVPVLPATRMPGIAAAVPVP